MSFPNDVDNLTDPVAGNSFANSQGLPSTQYIGRAQTAIMAVETAAIKRTSGNVLMADGFTGLPEVLISDAEALTNWTGVATAAAVLDPAHFTRGTQSISVSLSQNPANGSWYYNPPAAVAVAGHLFAAIDLRWELASGPSASATYFQAIVASGPNLTGTTATVNLGTKPEAVFFTVIVPLGALTTIGSFGIRCYTIGPTAGAHTQWWIDNLRLKAQSPVETALASGSQVGVIVPPSVPADVGRRILNPAETVLDMRPSSAVLGGHGGVRYAREWNLDETGTIDVSADLMGIFNALPAGTTFQLSPNGQYLCNGTVTLTLTDGVFDGNGATIFSNVQRTLNFHAGEDDHTVVINGNGITVKNLRTVGYRKDTFTGDQLTTVAATPTIVGTTARLDSINDEVRIPQQVLDTLPAIPIAGRNNLETPYYFRDKDGNIKFEAVLSQSTALAADCIFQVVDDEFPSIVIASATITVPQNVPTLFTRVFRGDSFVTERMRASVKKATATANVITVTSMTAYNTCGYRPNYQYPAVSEFAHGIKVLSGSGITIEGCEIEGPDGDGIALNNQASDNLLIRRCRVRGSGRHGLNPNSGQTVTIENCDIAESGRSGMDIEPTKVTDSMRDLTVKNTRFRNSRNYTVAASHFARNSNLLLENIESDGAGMGFMFGGSTYGSFHNITHRRTWRTLADRVANGGSPNADFILKGRNCHADGIVTELGAHIKAGTDTYGVGPTVYTASGNTLRNVKVTAAPSDSGSLIVEAPLSAIANGSTTVDTSSAALSFAAGAFVGQAQMASDATFSGLDLGALARRLPNTYKGPAFSEVWVPGGHNALQDPLYNVRGISGTAVKANNLAKVTVPIVAGAVGVTINFPPRTMPTFASVDAPVATLGGTLAAGTYYYRVAPRALYGGPGVALAETVGVTVGAPNNAVNLGIRRWAVDGDAQVAGVTVWRGTVPGTYTTRYDVAPVDRFYAIQQDVAVFTDRGTNLIPPPATASTWGYPATVGVSAGSLVPADESGFEADASYAIMIETSWPTSVGVNTKTAGGFHLDFGAAVPGVGGPYFLSWMLVRG